MSTHIICLRREIRKIIFGYPPLMQSYCLPGKVQEYRHHIIVVAVLNAGLNFLLTCRITLLGMKGTL